MLREDVTSKQQKPEIHSNELRNHILKKAMCLTSVFFLFALSESFILALLNVLKHCSTNKLFSIKTSLKSHCGIDLHIPMFPHAGVTFLIRLKMTEK